MTVTVKNNTPITVPEPVRQRAGFKPGDQVEFKVSGSMVTIVPKLPSADDEYTPAQRRVIDRGIAASEKEYAQGRSIGPFATHKEFIASLHAEARRLGDKKAKRTRR